MQTAQNRHYSTFEKSEILNAQTRISRSIVVLSGDLERLGGTGIKNPCLSLPSPRYWCFPIRFSQGKCEQLFFCSFFTAFFISAVPATNYFSSQS